METYDTTNGEKIATGQLSVFIIGAGGFQGKRTSTNLVPTIEPPKRKPDASVTQKTSYDQV